ncbi:MAG TPA: cupin domain-containing protein [Xanthobacteraceae bacterium]|jgi:uncharacterized cupin superfamily protein|nr:cupin domain-containing protein [Xanthobacteraceae bacterium]
MPKIDIANVKVEVSTGYPEPYRSLVAGRSRQRLGNVVGLDQFGVNLTRLKPGAQSALRHWHSAEDEFVFVVEGTLVLCENDGETILTAGAAAGFKAGIANGHCLINRSGHDAVYLEIGTRAVRDDADYPDTDLRVRKDENGVRYTNKSGEPYR